MITAYRNIFILSFSLLQICSLFGQASQYNLRFNLVSSGGGNYIVDIFMSFDQTGGLGSSNLVFTYSPDISSPTLISHGLSGSYSNPTLTTPASNTASFNVVLNNIGNGIGIASSPSETFIARVNFSIGNPNGNSNLQWKTTGTPSTVVFLDDETTLLNPNNLQNLNTSPLPLELLSFTTTPKSKTIQLDWTSNNEINFAGYELQRSTDGKNFDKIAWIESKANPLSTESYIYIDQTVRSGIVYYYRLKMIDTDGSFVYSPTRSARLEEVWGNPFLYPNPTDQSSTLIFNAPVEGNGNLTIFDSTGRLVLIQEINFSRGPNSYEVNLGYLAKGSYFMKFSEGPKVKWSIMITKTN